MFQTILISIFIIGLAKGLDDLDLDRADYFGGFRFTQHFVQGQLFSGKSGALFIHRFYYDGQGPGDIQINAVKVGENDYGKVNSTKLLAMATYSSQFFSQF